MVRLSERLRRRRPSAVPVSLRESSVPQLAPVDTDGQQRPVPRDLSRELAPGQLATGEQTVSRMLYERLGDEEIADIRRLIRETEPFTEFAAEPAESALARMVALHCGMWLGLDSVAERTGLPTDQPPEDVHAMARGPLSAAGGLYEADLVVDALRSARREVANLRAALDFGCSSGRVVRVLAAAYPSVRWYACDPNERSIAWAREHLPGIEFFVNPDQPPLELPMASLGLVFAISIWSHFEPQSGLEWFEEMRRLLAPGGQLVITTHGLASVAYYAGNGLRTAEQCEEIANALYRRGWWYASEFGDRGDWGVTSPNWGTAFLSPEWLLSNLCPRWRILEFMPGRNAGNQDLYVLERA